MLKSLVKLVILIAIILQSYLHFYPLLYTECRWPRNSLYKILAYGDPQITGHIEYQTLRKKIDILGNDMFLKQIASTTRRLLEPDFIAILGDLLSSQWISDEEFYKRADRFKQIFPVGKGEILNVSGNHDIGYHSEFTENRVKRFEWRFGRLNFVTYGPNYRIVVVNSLSLDGPPYDSYMNETIEFVQSLAGYGNSTILLTHVPLYKEEGICTDGPVFTYDDIGVKSQNHLSFASTQLLLNSLFGSNSSGMVLAGHDHEGCIAYYNLKNSIWNAKSDKKYASDIMEVTVRSMMGEFGGNVGLVSADSEMNWHFQLCRFHVQHIWWVTQVVSLIAVSVAPLLLL